MPRKEWESHWPFLIAAATAVLVWIWFLPSVHSFPLDDAYIHLAYVRTLAETGVLGLNPGEPSMGTSSQLWVYLLAALRVVHVLDDYWSIQILGLLLFIALVVTVVAITQTAVASILPGVREHRIAGVAAGLLISLNGDIHWMAGAGMETMLSLLLPFLAILSFGRRGFAVRVGVLCGLLYGARTPGVVLVGVFLILELIRGEWRRAARGVATAAAVAAPFLFVIYRITHGFIPTSAQGKLLTYVDHGIDLDGILHFSGRFLALQKYLPHTAFLGLFTIIGLRATLHSAGAFRVRVRRAVDNYPIIMAVAGFGLAHFSAYAFGFRTIGQQGRYMIEEQVVFVILGAVGLAFAVHQWLDRRVAIGLATVCVGVCVCELPYWRRVYGDNVRHVATAYIRMGRWVAENTAPDARIAAFDIGVLRYIGNRYTIDLGGLVDPAAHPFLLRHDCGPYARSLHATHILYSKDPETDIITGVNWSESAPTMVLKQTPLVQFAYHDYEAPTLTHSLRLALTHIDGWFRHGSDELAKTFVASDDAVYDAKQAKVVDGIDLVGTHLDTTSVHYMRPYPYLFDIYLYYRVTQVPTHRIWMHVTFFNDVDGRMVSSYNDLITNDVIPLSSWPVGKIMKDKHTFYIPYGAAGKHWHVRVCFTDLQLFDERYPGLYEWTDVDDFINQESGMNPLAPL